MMMSNRALLVMAVLFLPLMVLGDNATMSYGTNIEMLHVLSNNIATTYRSLAEWCGLTHIYE